MEWPKRARTADWENGVLTLDGEKKFDIPELTTEIMERLAGYTLVGFHVKGYPVTDELLAPFAGHKSMVNFGVENGTLTDACFPVFSAMPKLRILLLTGNAGIDGSGLSALQNCKLDLLTLNRTGLDDGGLLLRLERERPLPARLGLRLRPEPDRSFHKAEATRFGMRTGELLDTAQELRLKGVREVGLSAMLGLGLRDPEAFSALARALFTCAAALHDSFGLQVSYCCLGGGLPVAHRRTERDADIAAVSRGVQAEFSRIMEPSGLGGVPVETGLGRWLTAHAGILLTTVTGVKRGAQDWLGVDVSRADLLRPELYGTYHHISVLGDDRVEGRRRYAVGDRIPEPREPFGQRLLPECRRGARLVIHDVGAYGASMGYSYGLTPHCAEYLYQADGTLRCIRRAQREDELFSTLDENPDFTAPAETPSGQAESQRPSEG